MKNFIPGLQHPKAFLRKFFNMSWDALPDCQICVHDKTQHRLSGGLRMKM